MKQSSEQKEFSDQLEWGRENILNPIFNKRKVSAELFISMISQEFFWICSVIRKSLASVVLSEWPRFLFSLIPISNFWYSYLINTTCQQSSVSLYRISGGKTFCNTNKLLERYTHPVLTSLSWTKATFCIKCWIMEVRERRYNAENIFCCFFPICSYSRRTWVSNCIRKEQRISQKLSWEH